MTATTRRRFGRLAALAAMLVIAFATPAAAAEIEVDAPSEVAVGDHVELEITVTDDSGDPVVGARVTVEAAVAVVGESGRAEMRVGFTDESGHVTLEFTERAVAGTDQELEITAFTPEGAVVAAVGIEVLDGPQQHDTEAPAHLPVFSVWWLIVVLGIIWVVLIYAVSRLLVIRRASESVSGTAKITPYVMTGFVTFTAIGMGIVILNRPESHANLEPNEPFDRAPGAVLGEEYEYNGLGLGTIDTPVADLSGEAIYELANCSGCHGIAGEGAVVGGGLQGEILDDVDAFIGEVRRGPKSMPTYPEAQLDDDALERVIEYLEEAE